VNAVEQHNARTAATTMVGAFRIIDHLTADNDVLVEKVQAVSARLDESRAEVTQLTYELTLANRNAVAASESREAYRQERDESDDARDDAERECGELRDQLEAARCRIQELEGSDRQRADDL
jgi:chromosome segregation ATPase